MSRSERPAIAVIPMEELFEQSTGHNTSKPGEHGNEAPTTKDALRATPLNCPVDLSGSFVVEPVLDRQ